MFDKKREIEKGPYSILGLDPAEIAKMKSEKAHDAIRSAYRRQQKKWHPDSPSFEAEGCSTLGEIHTRLTVLVDAYDYLLGNASDKNPFHGSDMQTFSNTYPDTDDDFDSVGYERSGSIITVNNFRNFYDPSFTGWDRFLNLHNADCYNQSEYDIRNDQFGVGSTHKRLRYWESFPDSEKAALFNEAPDDQLILDSISFLTNRIFRIPAYGTGNFIYNTYFKDSEEWRSKLPPHIQVDLPPGNFLNGFLWPWSPTGVMAQVCTGNSIKYTAVKLDYHLQYGGSAVGIVDMYRISNLEQRNPQACASAIAALAGASKILSHYDLTWQGRAPEGHDHAQARYADLLSNFCIKHRNKIVQAMILIDPEFDPVIDTSPVRPLGRQPGALASGQAQLLSRHTK